VPHTCFISTPANEGSADTRGVESDAKFGLSAIEVRANLICPMSTSFSPTSRCRAVLYVGAGANCIMSKTSPMEKQMTNRIGNKDEAQQRSKQEKKEMRQTNLAREAVKRAIAKTKYRNQVKNQPQDVFVPPA
jgi:hypothetical protein